MLSFCRNFDDDGCPVPDGMLAKLLTANELSLPGLLDCIEPEIRPALAFFCYRRAHLQRVGLALAASCDESELVFLGGKAGVALFARSREQLALVRSKAASTVPPMPEPVLD
jgi:hypothetical protein